MTDPLSQDLMSQAADAFELAGAPADLRFLALASLDDFEAAERLAERLTVFCEGIESAALAAHARAGLSLAEQAALAQRNALTQLSLSSRHASGALVSYLSNSSSEG